MIVVVSGLPRSGTSLMMQMLEAGGMPLLADGTRQPDPDNPKGYYEFEPAKRLKHDASWLDAAEGRAVKLVSSLLFDLPLDRRYRVILMTRDLDEVLASQRDMLRRRGAEANGPEDAQMRVHFTRHLAKVRRFLAAAGNIDTLECDYRELLAAPAQMAARVAEFVGTGLAADRMAAAVDPLLHRHRAGAAADMRASRVAEGQAPDASQKGNCGP